MLVLKRKEGQAIDVGGNVRIILKEVRGGREQKGRRVFGIRMHPRRGNARRTR